MQFFNRLIFGYVISDKSTVTPYTKLFVVLIDRSLFCDNQIQYVFNKLNSAFFV